MESARSEIPAETMERWQRIVDVVARLAEAPASLIMRTYAPKHSVLVANQTEEHPYAIGREYTLNEKLYCYGVLRKDGELLVTDARSDPDWCDNEDLDDGMSFYVGYPIKWPDGEVFGTICILDTKKNDKAILFKEGLREFGQMIEADLALLAEVSRRRQLESALQDALDLLEQRVADRTDELQKANIALQVLITQIQRSRQLYDEQILNQIGELVAPHLAKLRRSLAEDSAGLAYLDLAEANLENITSSLAARLVTVLEVLTPMENDIAQLVMRGQSTKEIAQTLARGVSTIEFHRNNIRRKLGLQGRQRSLRSHLLSLK